MDSKNLNLLEQLIKNKGIHYNTLQKELGFVCNKPFTRLRRNPEKLSIEQIRIIAGCLDVDYFELMIFICSINEKSGFIKKKNHLLTSIYGKKKKDLL